MDCPHVDHGEDWLPWRRADPRQRPLISEDASLNGFRVIGFTGAPLVSMDGPVYIMGLQHGTDRY